jgi:hypothetical protein
MIGAHQDCDAPAAAAGRVLREIAKLAQATTRKALVGTASLLQANDIWPLAG